MVGGSVKCCVRGISGHALARSTSSNTVLWQGGRCSDGPDIAASAPEGQIEDIGLIAEGLKRMLG